MTTGFEDAWLPFEPAHGDPWDLRKVAHLHRRAGFGATWEELRRDMEAGPAASVARLLGPPAPTPDQTAILDGLRQGAEGSGDVQRLKAYWLYRMRFGSDPVREKLALFWHGHFATSIVKVESVRAMSRQSETLRRLALAPFSEILAAMVSDPAMLVWLDGGASRKGRPNENFAREFLELFTIGPGHYTESDVREAARAFSGWVDEGEGRSFADPDPEFRYDPAQHDDGPKTFLGRSGAWDAPDIVRQTLERPEAAGFLARKLYRGFVDETSTPPDGLIAPLATLLRENKYAIGPVLGVILRSRHFYSPGVERRRVKSPVEFNLGLARMLEIPRPALNLLAVAAACDREGQSLFAPPSVKGWDGGPGWINSATLLERLNRAGDFLWGHPDRGVIAYDPVAWAEARGLKPGDAAGAFLDLLLQGALDPEAKSLALAAGRDGTAVGLRKAIQRLIHCPEFQLA